MNTQLVTQLLNFVIDPMGYSPQLRKAEVKIPQIQELLGTEDSDYHKIFQQLY